MTAVRTRRLSDLYRRGQTLTLNDDEGNEAVTVWLQKLNPVESETASRNANAARARHLMVSRNHESDEYLATMNGVIDYSAEDLATFLASQELTKRSEGLEAEFAEEKEWNKDDYLQGLHDSWEEGGFKERYHLQEEEGPDEEAQRCFDELNRFKEELTQRLTREETHIREELALKPIEALQEMMVDKMLHLQADLAWLMEFRKSELWLGVREVDHHKSRYFKNRIDVDELEGEVVGQLIAAYAELNVPVTQGKDLPQTPPSSEASSLPETLETEASSGQLVATP